MLFSQQSDCVYCVGCAAVFDKLVALVPCECNNVAESAIQKSFEDLHRMAQQPVRALHCAICDVSFSLPNRYCGAGRPRVR
ncbi:hypothetical protein Y032_0276g1100 [Ancylostoma ceylanicum]|uniref:Uncharacterized protein n=1 Tax=Ancylostoma ceylanicum TaxID=53326 RepID=A0A016S8N5_9BILA|nr:hypothetical protein Y032_0276g1100 [Ancylostoma ceylanicum]